MLTKGFNMEKKMQFKITGSQKILLRKLWESKKWAAVLSHFTFSLSLFFVCYFSFPLFPSVYFVLPTEENLSSDTQEVAYPTH